MHMSEQRERFWQLLEPEYHGALMYCRKLTGSRELGDDIFQDSLLLAYTRFDSLREETSFRPWLYRIIINAFRSQTRRPAWKRMVAMTPEIELSLVGEDPVETHTARRWLRQAMTHLSPKDQALVTLHELQGWPISELAELHCTTEGAIKASLFRARRKMHKVLSKQLKRSASDIAADALGDQACVAAKPSSD
jgi:RNA polymerase sigma-70 factor (ECF subfamily)